MAQEVTDGVTVVALNPGIIDTPMLRSCFGEGAAGHEDPKAWAKSAVPMILGLDASDNGTSLSVYLLDVCGHGVGSALLSVSAMEVIRKESLPNVDFRDADLVVTAVNRAFPMEKNNGLFEIPDEQGQMGDFTSFSKEFSGNQLRKSWC